MFSRPIVGWLLCAVLVSLLAGCAPGERNPLDEFRQDITASDKGTVEALTDKFDTWLAPEEFGVSLTIMRIAQGIVGFLLLVAGYAIYEFFIMLPGIVIGGAVGYGVGADQHAILGFLLMIVGASIGGSLLLALHQLAIFLVGAIFGAFLLGAVIDWNIVVLVIGGLLGGSILLALFHLSIVVITAGTGAILFGGLALGASPTIITVLFFVGMAVQYGMLAQESKEEPAPA